jgi:hypothetical protein
MEEYIPLSNHQMNHLAFVRKCEDFSVHYQLNLRLVFEYPVCREIIIYKILNFKNI